MLITARVINYENEHKVTVGTDGQEKTIAISAKSIGKGSSVNGAELLLLSIATCFCNDIYREAGRRNLEVRTVDVTCMGEFGEAEPGKGIRYSVKVDADADQVAIAALIADVDRIAEIHQTLRNGTTVTRVV